VVWAKRGGPDVKHRSGKHTMQLAAAAGSSVGSLRILHSKGHEELFPAAAAAAAAGKGSTSSSSSSRSRGQQRRGSNQQPALIGPQFIDRLCTATHLPLLLPPAATVAVIPAACCCLPLAVCLQSSAAHYVSEHPQPGPYHGCRAGHSTGGGGCHQWPY
jgi:hypothetical protein